MVFSLDFQLHNQHEKKTETFPFGITKSWCPCKVGQTMWFPSYKSSKNWQQLKTWIQLAEERLTSFLERCPYCVGHAEASIPVWFTKIWVVHCFDFVIFQHTTISITWIKALIDETEFWQQNIWTLHRLHKKKLKKITTCSLNEMIWFKILFVKPKGSRGYWSDWLSALGLHWQASGCPLVMVTG